MKKFKPRVFISHSGEVSIRDEYLSRLFELDNLNKIEDSLNVTIESVDNIIQGFRVVDIDSNDRLSVPFVVSDDFHKQCWLHGGNLYPTYGVPLEPLDFSKIFDFGAYKNNTCLQDKLSKLRKRFEETGDVKFLFRIKRLLDQEKSLLYNKIKDRKKLVNKLLGKLYRKNSTHKLISKKLSRLLSHGLSDPSGGDDDNNSTVIDMPVGLFFHHQNPFFYESRSKRLLH